MSARWCLIESDPAVFTELIERIGVKNISVEELLDLEPASLQQYGRVYGLIFLFKWNSTRELAPSGTVVKDAPVFFARQVVEDACATLALVNTLCNYPDGITLGDNLSNFLSFTQDLDPELRGSQIGDYEPLRNAHNSFAPPEAFAYEGKGGKDKDVYHFVSFIFRNGSIWELDGLQEGPILCADANEENYRTAMVEVVQKRIAEISAQDTTGVGQGISFSLLAVVDDPIVQLENTIAKLQAEEKPVAALQSELASLKEQRERGRLENVRRRHGYHSMIVELLKALAEKGVLEDVVKEVHEKQEQRKKEKEKEKEKMASE